jgi:hypothetical protein
MFSHRVLSQAAAAMKRASPAILYCMHRSSVAVQPASSASRAHGHSECMRAHRASGATASLPAAARPSGTSATRCGPRRRPRARRRARPRRGATGRLRLIWTCLPSWSATRTPSSPLVGAPTLDVQPAAQRLAAFSCCCFMGSMQGADFACVPRRQVPERHQGVRAARAAPAAPGRPHRQARTPLCFA